MDGKESKHIPLSHRRKSGSGTRRKTRPVCVRVTDEDFAVLDAKAAAQSLTVPSYLRRVGLKSSGVRSRRRGGVDGVALSAIHAELRRIGGNINQIARALNMGQVREAEAVLQIRAAALETMRLTRLAMGFES